MDAASAITRPQHAAGLTLPAASALGALGVVYGDIGTSPLYAFKAAIKAASPAGLPGPETVLGVTSLILWSLLIVISFKYAILILRADNRGEGGIVALLAVLRARHARPRTWRAAVLIVGLIGAALLYGDGAITPAISVLGAIEGLKVDAPQVAPAIVPITVIILAVLFWLQSKGTGFIGRLFGPVMLVWFAVIAVLGAAWLWRVPGAIAAVDPSHAIRLILGGDWGIALAVLGATFLAVTGGEAMYADMGHFGRGPIRLAWFSVVLPSLVLNYLGQAALLMTDPAAIENPFFRMAPDWAHYALVGFATAAAVIASQAIITGVFSLTQQSIQLGFLPRITVLHTASEERGQIYVPTVNWILAAATLAAVVLFGSSDALAGAYGIAVSLLMAITTVLAALVALKWGYSLWLVALVNGAFLLVDLVFFAANSLKVFEGGWFPLLLTAAVAFLMLTWRQGQRLTETARAKLREREEDFLAQLRGQHCMRVPGTAAFLSAGRVGVPLALTHHLRHIAALHRRVIFVTVLTAEEPRADPSKRAEVIDLGCGVNRVVLQFGFMESPAVPPALQSALEDAGAPLEEPQAVSYYIGHETVLATDRIRGMAVWREQLYSLLQRNVERSAAYFCVPAQQVVEMGIELEI